MKDDRGLLADAARLLAPGGTVLVTVPAYRWLWTSHDDDNMHERRYSPAELSRCVERAGLEVMRSGALFFWPALVKLAGALRERLLGVPFRGSELPSPAVNSFLTRLSVAEGRMMLRIPVPAGSSLWLLACGACASGPFGGSL